MRHSDIISVFIVSALLVASLAYAQSNDTTSTTSPAPTAATSETSTTTAETNPEPAPTSTTEPAAQPQAPASEPIQTSACPVAPQPMSCLEGEALVANTDSTGCVVSFQCAQSAITQPEAQPMPAQGQASCPADSQQQQLKEDCSKQGGNPVPFTQNGCVFYNCQFQRQSAQGGTAAQPSCPPEPVQMKQDCTQKGGNPVPFTQNGCVFYNCQFQQGNQFNPTVQQACPSESDIRQATEKCSSMGGTSSVSFAGSCKVPQCISKGPQRQMCPEDEDPSIKQRITQECKERDGYTYSGFDPNGCTITICSRQGGFGGPVPQRGPQPQGTADAGICSRAPPVQAVTNCKQQGGQLVTQTNRDGCITDAQCVTRGDITDTYVQQVSQVPDTTVLLDIAFSMEQLKMKLDQLSRQTEDIAAYYESVGSTDAQKYMRVSQMFLSAMDKVSEIQTELRDRLDDLTIDDVTRVKSDVRYVKDVMLKDALYLMLTNDNEDIQSITTQPAARQPRQSQQPRNATQQAAQPSENDCGNDGYCFDQAIRICKPVKFRPDPSAPEITITGLQGNSCVVEMTLPEGQGPPAGTITGINPPYTATCKLDDYALGFGLRGPQDMPKYCTGSLVELTKKSPRPPQQEPRDMGLPEQGVIGQEPQEGGMLQPQAGLQQPLPPQQPIEQR